MKVALIIDTWFPTVGGGQTNAWEISKRLAGNGISIDIITRNTGPDSFNLPKNLNVIKLGAKIKSSDYISKITFLSRSYFFIAGGNYDLVHAHAFLPGITARLISVTKSIPAVFTVHGTSIDTDLNNLPKAWLEKFILTQILYSAQITVSRDFLRIKNINKNIAYISNGVEIENFDRVKAKKAGNPTLLFVGRLHPQKNLPNLFRAINIVKKDIPNIKLIIVGDGEQKESLKKIAKDLGLTSNISFKGETQGQELIRFYKSSSAFILPSIYEGQPLTLLEAWAAKLPVIVTATGDLPYLVRDGYNGYLIKNHKDAQGIASQIKKALSSKNLEDLGQNGYNLVTRDFSWEKSAQKTLEVYESLTKAQN
ncbi:MAG: glycosyltransferase family 4 protein [Candidatus Curtissbacteria bacterium]|nr:glycosyltransferase family 4 protein [Candidatus Curtissbacteria bacterium]